MADNTNNLYFKIGLVTKGAYSATATYAVNDTVQASDGLYASRKSNNTGHALSETEWWAKIIDLTAAAAATSAATTAAGAAITAAANAEEKIQELEGYQEDLQALQNDVNRFYSDFAEYDKVDHPDIVFGTPTHSGAIVNGNGAVVPMAGYNVSNPIAVTKGLLYKLFIGVGASIPENIAVFAIRRVSEDGRVVYTPAFVSSNTTKVSRLGYLVFFASENAEIVFSYPTTTTKVEVAEYGVLKSLATQLDNLRKEVDLKSFTDSYYAQMSVGYARNLIMPNTPTEQEFTQRQSGGGVIESGVSTYDKVMGKSLVWNNHKRTTSSSYQVQSRVENESFVLSAPSPVPSPMIFTFGYSDASNIIGHRYLLSCDIIPNDNTGEGITISYNNPNRTGLGRNIVSGKVGNTYYCLATRNDVEHPAAAGIYVIGSAINSGDFATIPWDSVQIVDLTQMFGAGNEPTTYEEFLQRKPKVEDEFAYNEGEIINNKVEKVVSIGIQIWDEKWAYGRLSVNDGRTILNQEGIYSVNFIPIMPNTQYYWTCVKNAAVYILYYDKNHNYIGWEGTYIGKGVFTIDNPQVAFIRFYFIESYGGTYHNDVIFNISNPAINGQYFPYEEHTLDLSWIGEIKDENGVALFEDGMRSAGSAYDEAGASKAVKRFVEIDLGNLDWRYVDAGNKFFSAGLPLSKEVSDNVAFNGLCSKYPATSHNHAVWEDGVDKVIASRFITHEIEIVDSTYGNDDVAFKAAMQGVKLIYELATPIEVEYSPKSMSLEVVAGGTETAIATEDSTPMRAMIAYGIDAVATILSLVNRVTELERRIIN